MIETFIGHHPHRYMDTQIREEYLAIIGSIINDGEILPSGNSVIREFEQALAQFCAADYAVSTGSGTIALIVALRACELSPGSEVITTPFTYQATASAIIQAGLKPVFADIDLSTLQLSDKEVVRQITPNTTAILPVHLCGSFCNIKHAREAARAKGIKVIEDSAQRLVRNAFSSTSPDIICYSLGPTKNIVGYAEAGAIVTSDAEVATRCHVLIKNGNIGNFFHSFIGYNGVIDAIASGILLVNLKYVEAWIERCNMIANLYDAFLSSCKDISLITRSVSSTSKYSIFVSEKRDELFRFLRDDCGVEVAIYYPTPLHLQPCFASLGYARGDFPNAERAADHILSLPIHHRLQDEDIIYICEKINHFYS